MALPRAAVPASERRNPNFRHQNIRTPQRNSSKTFQTSRQTRRLKGESRFINQTTFHQTNPHRCRCRGCAPRSCVKRDKWRRRCEALRTVFILRDMANDGSSASAALFTLELAPASSLTAMQVQYYLACEDRVDRRSTLRGPTGMQRVSSASTVSTVPSPPASPSPAAFRSKAPSPATHASPIAATTLDIELVHVHVVHVHVHVHVHVVVCMSC